MIVYTLGEEKYVTATIKPKRNSDVVVVTRATYELIDEYKQVVETGSCDIDGKELSVLLEPEKAGIYKLKMTVKVGPETIIKTCEIKVVEE